MYVYLVPCFFIESRHLTRHFPLGLEVKPLLRSIKSGVSSPAGQFLLRWKKLTFLLNGTSSPSFDPEVKHTPSEQKFQDWNPGRTFSFFLSFWWNYFLKVELSYYRLSTYFLSAYCLKQGCFTSKHQFLFILTVLTTIENCFVVCR